MNVNIKYKFIYIKIRTFIDTYLLTYGGNKIYIYICAVLYLCAFAVFGAVASFPITTTTAPRTTGTTKTVWINNKQHPPGEKYSINDKIQMYTKNINIYKYIYKSIYIYIFKYAYIYLSMRTCARESKKNTWFFLFTLRLRKYVKFAHSKK